MNPLTPLEHYPDLAKAIGLTDVYFKREDLHPLGSHKGRSIPVMIDNYLNKNETKFAISSSGNAALAAALYIKKLTENSSEPKNKDLELDIFVGNHITPNKLAKLKKLENEHIRVLIKERPLQALIQASNEGVRSLRQSTDDIALVGYESLAQELKADLADVRHPQSIPGTASIFIGTSSGTTAQALAQFFTDPNNKKPALQVHLIQTSSCHPIADAFDDFDIPNEKSEADAIVDQTAHRKAILVDLIKETGGRGWVATNEEISNAQNLVKKHTGLSISTNSALSVAGAMQAAYMGYETGEAVICMICGE